MRILDLRKWNPDASGESDPSSMIYGYRRLKVFKLPGSAGKNHFRIRLLTTSPQTQVRFPPQQVPAKVRMSPVDHSPRGRKECRWEASFDFTRVPAGDYVDLIVEQLSPGLFLQRGENSTTLTFEMQAESAEVTRWLLLPKGREYRSFRIIRYKTGEPDKVEVVRVVTEYLAEDSTILAYKLLS